MSPSRFNADFERHHGGATLPNFASAPPLDGVRPHAVRPQQAMFSFSSGNLLPSLQPSDMQSSLQVATQNQLQMFRQVHGPGAHPQPPFVTQLSANSFRSSPVQVYGGPLTARKPDDPPMSLSPTPAALHSSQGVPPAPPVVHLPHGARIIHHSAGIESTTPSVVTPDVRYWKHDTGKVTEERVTLPRQYARGGTKRKPCNCKQSRCLKLYCECFAAGQVCQSCNCVNCANNPENDVLRQDAIRSTMKRSPPSQKINKVCCC